MNQGNRIPWLALGVLVAVLLAIPAAHLTRQFPIMPECPMKARLGIPCATCGLTRCVWALTDGRWAEAFHWHPVAVVLFTATPLAVLWDLRRAWLKIPYPPLPDSLAARMGVAVFLAGTWLLQVIRHI